MKYLLIGINGVYNYGCEAIVRGSVNILRAFDPQAEITYATLSPDYDRKMLADCGLEIIPRRFISRFSFPRLARRLAACLGIEIPVMFDLKETATEKQYDYVLSIGGDIYTLSPDNKEYPSALMLFGDYCEKNGRHYILWGASVGPFSANPGVEKKVKEHLLRISGITSREKKSTEYLKSIGLGGRLLECADPAFTVAAEITKETGSFSGAIPEKIALNLSPLSLCYTGQGRKNGIAEHRVLVGKLLEMFPCEIILVPHVCPPDEGIDDDYSYLNELYRSLPETLRSRVRLLPRGLGFIATKTELIKCDLCIAARMHCAINAMTAYVPTVLLSYSSKASGMAEYVYGSRKYVCALENVLNYDFSGNINLSEQHCLLKARIPAVTRAAYSAMKIFKAHGGKEFSGC